MRDEMWGDTVEILMWAEHQRESGSRAIAVGQPVEFKTLTDADEQLKPLPTLTMGRIAAQNLMDELWHVGLRPTEGTGSAGSLAATERHLADMRALVRKALNADLPERK